MGSRISKQHPFIATMDIRANGEREGMQTMQRREGRVADGERGKTCRWREGKDVRMGRDEGRGVANGLDIRHGVDNGLDRDRVDVVVDVINMPALDTLAFQVLLLKAAPRWNTISDI